MAESQDREIVLGTGRLLLMFFGLVVICGGFFVVGYRMGGANAQQVAAANQTLSLPPAVPASGAPKPSAVSGPQQQAANGTATTQELTFYKSVEQPTAPAQLTPENQPPQQPATAQQTPATPGATATPTPNPPVPELKSTGHFMVQVAAVSKQEDADALATALRAKNYPVVVLDNMPEDKLFHVQVGPFADVKEAEAMRTRLASDGYNPILKK